MPRRPQGMIVHHDQFQVRVGLVQDRSDRKRKRIIPPVHRHDDADQWTAFGWLHSFILVLFQCMEFESRL